jgi:hypothetical protein
VTRLMPAVTRLLSLGLQAGRGDTMALSAGRLGQWRTRMNLLWIRPASAEQALNPDERRVRDYMDSPGGVSESASSLADKMGISRRRCRGILEELVQQGVVQRREFADIEPMYLRFPSR